ncbi:MAG TPA: hypothetical protein VNN62_16355 [Methylomirabilota bacterium]|nr:hypothetical protein [Methylomirabilota bacterium]
MTFPLFTFCPPLASQPQSVRCRSIRRGWLTGVVMWLCWLGLVGGWAGHVYAQNKGQGSLIVSIDKTLDQQSDSLVQIFAQGETTALATAHLGTPVTLPAGVYRITLPLLNGSLARDDVLVKAGRTSTVILSNIAGVRINVLDKQGTDLGVGVEIYDSASGARLGAFLSGETILALPAEVDIKIAVPPQAQWMRKVELHPNGLAQMDFREQVYGALTVRPLLDGRDISTLTEVTISQAGVNKVLARSEPGPAHRFTLTPGAYDLVIMNRSGHGKPFVQERVEIAGEGPIEKEVPLDEDRPSPSPPPPRSL